MTAPSTHPWGHSVAGDQQQRLQEGSALLFIFFCLVGCFWLWVFFFVVLIPVGLVKK